ncbi:M14 metallopeptidase family protein [Dyadobacter sp. CY312]|uniref:M14 family metallopeptidase n=1 Tax=Dyadobacter sp. CY312 TaxID=2907303 RepID=UPI001F3F4191|nr:M14 metallopeptidase family protein [Dyadobacter sp. CY312]MCE7041444.1 M14 family metallopeptidase [Dyadobacter sp. CY312]
MINKFKSLLLAILFLVTHAAWSQVPSPKEHFGFDIGDDYMLANFTKTEEYFKKLEKASDRLKLTVIGKTEEGRDQYMLIVSSPENLKKLDRYKEISTKMARAEGVSEEQARALAAEGKAIVWIDGGLHATEVVGIHQLIETIYQVLSRNDAETKRILDNVVILFTHANPDGQELTSNWYMREKDPLKRKNENLPKLYQKYIGHDNNRDFFIQNMKESRNMGYQLFVEWIPQIMYNHHQRGPAGSVLAGPPYRDPFNYVFDPMMVTGIDAVGAAMYNRLNAENKPGFTRLNGSSFSTWYNGGLRTTTHFHNMIGILTEIIGGPTPEEIPLVPERLIPNNNTPNPVTPQKKWHFKQSIDYSVSLNYAILDHASRNSDHLLYNIYSMGKNSIKRGSGDYWTPSPKRVDEINAAYKADQAKAKKPEEANSFNSMFGGNFRGGSVPTKYYETIFEAPVRRDPRGYIISADQSDFPTAVKYINALVRTGIQIEKATAAFQVAGKSYPAGSYIVKTAQAFRPHVLDMFEPQDYPNDFQYPGGPPVRPYDAAGWTLAYQMGVKFDRILDAFDGPFEKLPYGQLQLPVGKAVAGSAGYEIKATVNDAFIAVNDLLKAGADVYRLADGTFYIPQSAKAKATVEKSAKEFGVQVAAVSKKPAGAMEKVAPLKVALWDTYGGSMPSGWVRWMLEQFHFPFNVVFSKEIDGGDLRKKYDVIVFVTRAISAPSARDSVMNAMFRGRGPKAEEIPSEFHDTMGSLTAAKSFPELKKFLEAGGKIVTIGSSTSLAYHLGLPVRNAITELTPEGESRPLPNEKYFIPGSILNVSVDTTAKASWGMAAKTDVYFDNSPVFTLAPDAVAKGTVKPLAWFPNNTPLRSGWAWGQAYLQGGVTAFEAKVGAGKLYAFGPEITFRSQSHGTFKWLFNQLY